MRIPFTFKFCYNPVRKMKPNTKDLEKITWLLVALDNMDFIYRPRIMIKRDMNGPEVGQIPLHDNLGQLAAAFPRKPGRHIGRYWQALGLPLLLELLPPLLLLLILLYLTWSALLPALGCVPLISTFGSPASFASLAVDTIEPRLPLSICVIIPHIPTTDCKNGQWKCNHPENPELLG